MYHANVLCHQTLGNRVFLSHVQVLIVKVEFVEHEFISVVKQLWLLLLEEHRYKPAIAPSPTKRKKQRRLEPYS